MTLRELPRRTLERRDTEDPTVTRSRIVHPEPKRKAPKIDIEEPSLTRDLVLIVEPRQSVSRQLKALARRDKPKIDRDDPKRTLLLAEKPEPSVR
jgi:hypothetical protein